MEINFKTMPQRMRKLSRDPRGLPVPWFVKWIDGKPEFRLMNPEKMVRAVRERRCWVCGEHMHQRFAFVVGPMCGINRISSEPPSHVECARWSAQNCPFLNNPKMVRREDEEINNAKYRDNAAGEMVMRNPGVTMLWISRGFEVIQDGKGKPLFVMIEPEAVEWFREGRAATRAEVLESVEQGLPVINAAAQRDGNVAMVARLIERFERYLPPAVPENVVNLPEID